MKKTILFIIAILLISCEKDDICDANTPTTPKLVINFYDVTTNAAKNVTKLAVYEEGNATALATFNAVDVIKIPLKTSANTTKYRFVLNSGNTAAPLPNEDILEFNYSRNNVFISRACGYKTLFTLNQSSPTLTDFATPDGLWIQSKTVQTTNITSENEIHIKIKF